MNLNTTVTSACRRLRRAWHINCLQQRKRCIRLSLLPASVSEIAVLDDRAAYLHDELCYFHEPTSRWVLLPQHLQQQIDAGLWMQEIACLQVKGLVEVCMEVAG